MFVQNKATINPKHKNGLALRSRRAGQEILVQWANGEQRWCESGDIVGSIRFVELEKSGEYDHD
jgi:hypothetical protein